MLVSIVLPTYNGKKHLQSTLESIVQQIDAQHSNEVELLIQDDASTDSSMDIIRSFQEKYEYIQVYENTHNIGMDRNFFKGVLHAKGTFIWFAGQDDIFLPEAVAVVLNTLKSDSTVGLVILNHNQITDDGTYIAKRVLDARYLGEDDLGDTTLTFSGIDDYLHTFIEGPTFLPTTIMRKDFWNTQPIEDYVGTHYTQYAVAMLQTRNYAVVVIGRPYINGIVPQNGWQKSGRSLYAILVGGMRARFLVYHDIHNPFSTDRYTHLENTFLKNLWKLIIQAGYLGYRQTQSDLKLLAALFKQRWSVIPYIYGCYLLSLLIPRRAVLSRFVPWFVPITDTMIRIK